MLIQVSELTADLAEEHATSTLATERLEAESAQRMKLDKDFNDLVVSQCVIQSLFQLLFINDSPL